MLYVRRARYIGIPPAAGETDDVIINSQFRKSVVFVMGDERLRRNKREPKGTAFFVAIQVADISIVYAVTARHVIEMNQDTALGLRVPTATGFQDLPAPSKAWTCHPGNDVAAVRVPVNDEEFETIWTPLDRLMTKAKIAQQREEFGWNIGEGDDVFYPGLFTPHPGAKRILPVLRFGHIALMPYEPLPVEWSSGLTKRSFNVDAYLIEARSWHGFSGSPVCIYYPIEEVVGTRLFTDSRWPNVRSQLRRTGEIRSSSDGRRGISGVDLLGVISSFWDYKIGSRKQYSANAGLALVIPADAIYETLMQEPLMKEREEIERQEKARRPAPIPASTGGENANPMTRGSFEKTLKRVSRRLSPPARRKKGT